MFDYEVRINPHGIVHHLEINIEGKLAYENDFENYHQAACFAEQFLMDKYRKRDI
jgi:hypothetical protein